MCSYIESEKQTVERAQTTKGEGEKKIRHKLSEMFGLFLLDNHEVCSKPKSRSPVCLFLHNTNKQHLKLVSG